MLFLSHSFQFSMISLSLFIFHAVYSSFPFLSAFSLSLSFIITISNHTFFFKIIKFSTLTRLFLVSISLLKCFLLSHISSILSLLFLFPALSFIFPLSSLLSICLFSMHLSLFASRLNSQLSQCLLTYEHKTDMSQRTPNIMIQALWLRSF